MGCAHITSIHCPHSKVIVLGAGAGGDVAGALAAGHAVFAIEEDPIQFGSLVARFNSLREKFNACSGDWTAAYPSAFAGGLGAPGLYPAPAPASPSRKEKRVKTAAPPKLEQGG